LEELNAQLVSLVGENGAEPCAETKKVKAIIYRFCGHKFENDRRSKVQILPQPPIKSNT